jgi:toxin ParE1/3/4
MSSPKLPVVLTDRARQDYEDILEQSYLAWGEEQERLYDAAFTRALEGLTDFPFLGQARDDLAPGTRSLPVEHHVIYYSVTETAVRIDRILHKRMQAAGRLGD